MSRSVCICFSVLAVLAFAENEEFVPVRFKACKSAFEVISVEATGCPQEDNKCVFKHESKPRIRIGFKPDREVQKLSAAVRAKLDKTFVSFHLENGDACVGQNLTCPLKAGQLYYYSQEVNIVREYPTVDVLVNWMLNDPDQPKAEYFDAENERIKNDVCVVFKGKVISNE